MAVNRHTLHDPQPETEEEFFDEPSAPGWFAVSRGAAFFVGAVSLLFLVGEMRFPHFNATSWWLDLRPLPKPAARGLLALTAVLLLLFAFFPRAAPGLRRLAALCTMVLLGLTSWNAWQFYHHLSGVRPGSEMPLPFALHVAACLIVVVPGLLAAGWERADFFKDFLVGMLTIATCLAAFPAAQCVCLAKSDDRAAADALVVFADGAEAATDAATLAEQIRAAGALYRDGKIHKVVLAGCGESPEETQSALRRLATGERIPDKDLLLSAPTAEVEASVAATAKLLQEQKLAKIVVAARFYQLPRIKLCCQRAGLDVRTVPVHEKIRLHDLRPSLFREASALWLCILQPLSM